MYFSMGAARDTLPLLSSTPAQKCGAEIRIMFYVSNLSNEDIFSTQNIMDSNSASVHTSDSEYRVYRSPFARFHIGTTRSRSAVSALDDDHERRWCEFSRQCGR